MSRTTYVIRAAGEVPERLFEDFKRVTVTFDPAGSTIHVDRADEAELYGVLDALRREGFVLAELRRNPDHDRLATDQPAHEHPVTLPTHPTGDPRRATRRLIDP